MTITKIVTGVIQDGTITSDDMALDPRNASNLNSGDVPIGQLGNVAPVDLNPINTDIALLAFKTQANGNLARYNLLDQSVDSFEDASGVNASSSTNDIRDASGKYYVGETQTSGTVQFETDANTQVLYHFDGVDGSTTFTDSSGNSLNATAYGNAQLDTAKKKIGTASYEAAGTNPYIRTAASTRFKSTGDFTVESWVNSTYTTHSAYLDFRNPNNGLYMDWHYQGNAGRMMFCFGDDVAASTRLFDCTNIEDGNWHHIALVRDSSDSWYFYYDGVSISPITGGMTHDLSKEINPDGSGIYISTNPATTGTWYGHKDEFRFSNNVRYPSGTSFTPNAGTISTPADLTLISNAQTAQAQPTKADVVLTYTNGAGTATINTDLIASVSRDGGTTYTAVTLASQGTTGGQTISSASSVDISGQPSGTSMVWKVATANQSGSKKTRINGVSLGWA